MTALRLYLFAHYFGLGAVLPLLALGLQARGFRPSQYAWLVVLIPLSRLCAPPLWGALADRYVGAMRLLRINTALAAAAMFALFMAQGFLATTLAFACWALVSSSLMPLVEAGAYRLLGPAASGFGYVRVFGSIGFALSAFGMGFFGVDRELRAPFAVAACAYVVAGFSAGGLADAAAPTRAPLLAAVRGLLGRVDVLLLWLGSVLYYAAHGAFDTYFGPFARTIPGVSAETVSSAWALGVTCEVAVLWFVPRWIDSRARPLLLMVAACVAALRWAILAQATTPFGIWVQQPLHAVTFGVWYLAFVHENQTQAPPEIRATVQGVAQACIGGGMIASTLLGGSVLEQLGGRALFRLASLASVLALACYGLRQFLMARGAARLAAPSSGS